MTEEDDLPRFPEQPPEGASTQQTLRYMIDVTEIAKQLSAEGSPRIVMFSSLQRFARAAIDILDRHDEGGPPMRNIAVMLECRDVARQEQASVDSLLRVSHFSQDEVDVINYYKFHLARIEATSLNSIAYVGTNREADPETGGWWAQQAGNAIMELIGVAPSLQTLPADSERYRRYRSRQGIKDTGPHIVEGEIRHYIVDGDE